MPGTRAPATSTSPRTSSAMSTTRDTTGINGMVTKTIMADEI